MKKIKNKLKSRKLKANGANQIIRNIIGDYEKS